eukprot:163555_1
MAQAVLEAYLSKYNKSPKQPAHLIAFSKQHPDFSTINYGSAKQAISQYNYQQKYMALKNGASTKNKNKSKKNQKILSKAWDSGSKSKDHSKFKIAAKKSKSSSKQQSPLKPQQIITPQSITNINTKIQNKEHPLTSSPIISKTKSNSPIIHRMRSGGGNSPYSHSASTS